MSKLQEACSFLGPMYSVIYEEGSDIICRKINDNYDYEVVYIDGNFTVNLWMINPCKELMAIYSGIKTKEDLADTLGYLSFKYQNLSSRIKVEREDLPQ